MTNSGDLQPLSKRELALLERVVERHSPSLLGLVAIAKAGGLETTQREALRSVLLDELLQNLGPDDEPSQYGAEIDTVIMKLAAH